MWSTTWRVRQSCSHIERSPHRFARSFAAHERDEVSQPAPKGPNVNVLLCVADTSADAEYGVRHTGIQIRSAGGEMANLDRLKDRRARVQRDAIARWQQRAEIRTSNGQKVAAGGPGAADSP